MLYILRIRVDDIVNLLRHLLYMRLTFKDNFLSQRKTLSPFNMHPEVNTLVKGFENHDISIIKGITDDKPVYWFKANDVAKVIDISNIRSSIQHFTEFEKVVREIDTPGGRQKVTFLSSRGVYRLLYGSSKPIAVKFRNWVGDILDDIFFNEARELKKQIETYHQKLREIESCYKSDKHNTLVTSYDQRPVVYLADIGNNQIKYGKSDNLKDRVNTHKRVFGEHFTLIHVVECKYNGQLETKLQKSAAVSKRLMTFEDSNGDTHREIFQLDNDFQVKDLIETLDYLKRELVYDIEQKEKHLAEQVHSLREQFTELKNNLTETVKQCFENAVSETQQNIPTIVRKPNVVNVPPLPALPSSVENMRSFYTQWKNEFKLMFETHIQECGSIQWRKVFGAKLGPVMTKRHHSTKDFLEFLDKHQDNSEELLTLFETFTQDNNIPHSSFIKRCFYGALRPTTSYFNDPAYKTHIQNFLKLMNESGIYISV